MAEYVQSPLEVDSSDLQEEMFSFLQTRWPDWTPNAGSLTAWIVSAATRLIAENREVASDVPSVIFRFFGERIFHLAPVDASPGRVLSTWTLSSNPDGTTIPEGFSVGIQDADGVLHPFQVADEFTLASGVTQTAVGAVLLVSVEEGEEMTGLGGVGIQALPIDSNGRISTVTLTSTTSGGQDAETDTEYMDRLSDELTLLTPRPVVPPDFEKLSANYARLQGYNVRAVAVDGYDPNTGTDDNPRTISLFYADKDTGEDIPGTLRDQIASYLQAQRELNFNIYTLNPSRTAVNVSFDGIAVPGFDPAAVQELAIATVRDFLDPVNWGVLIEGSNWLNETVIRQQAVSKVLNNIPQFSHWTRLDLTATGAATDGKDLILPGRVALPSVGTITGNVS